AELKAELTRLYTEGESWAKLAALHAREAEVEGLAPHARVEALCHAADILRTRAADPAGASALLRRALEIDPSDRDVLLALIDAATALGQHGGAVEALDHAIAATPGDAWLHRSRADLHEALGQRDRALADLEVAYDRSGGSYAAELLAALEAAVKRRV